MHDPTQARIAGRFAATDTATAILATLQHPPTAAVVVEMAQLRNRARLLVRGPHRPQDLYRIEARMRQLRSHWRQAVGETDTSDTRERSLASAGLTPGGAATSWRAM